MLCNNDLLSDAVGVLKIDRNINPLVYPISLLYGILNKRRIIEFKRLESIEQLNKYSDDERFNKDTIKKYAVIFASNNVKLIEEVN